MPDPRYSANPCRRCGWLGTQCNCPSALHPSERARVVELWGKVKLSRPERFELRYFEKRMERAWSR